jgi:hypothetical protein
VSNALWATLLPLGTSDQTMLFFEGIGGLTLSQLNAMVLTPWSAWPPNTTAPTLVTAAASFNVTFAVETSTTYGMLFGTTLAASSPNAAQSEIALSTQVPTMGPATPQLVDAMGQVAVFLVEDNGVTLAAWTRSTPGLGRTDVEMRLVGAGLSIDASSGGLCADDTPPGAAIALDGSFLGAVGTSQPFGACAGAAPSPATSVQLFRVREDGASPLVDPLVQVPLSGQLSWVALTPRTGGAWLLTQDLNTDGVVIRPLDAKGTPGAPICAVASQGTAVAAAPFGDGFALAWIESTTLNAPRHLAVGLFDASGAELGVQRLQLDAATGGLPTGLVTSPATSAVLVGWASGSAGVHVARFGCPGG